MGDKILGMNKKTFGIVLSVGGGLLFTWASSQISNMPPDFLMPLVFVQQNHMWIFFYRILQLVGVVAAIYGGVQTYKNFNKNNSPLSEEDHAKNTPATYNERDHTKDIPATYSKSEAISTPSLTSSAPTAVKLRTKKSTPKKVATKAQSKTRVGVKKTGIKKKRK